MSLQPRKLAADYFQKSTKYNANGDVTVFLGEVSGNRTRLAVHCTLPVLCDSQQGHGLHWSALREMENRKKYNMDITITIDKIKYRIIVMLQE